MWRDFMTPLWQQHSPAALTWIIKLEWSDLFKAFDAGQ
jgi:hypothetical protein